MKRSFVAIVGLLVAVMVVLPEGSASAGSRRSRSRGRGGRFSEASWTLFLPCQMAVGFGGGSDIGYGRKDPGVILAADLLSTARGFHSLGGLGFGSALYEVMASQTKAPYRDRPKWSTSGLPGSWLPLYTYYPILSMKPTKLKGLKNVTVYSPFVYAFAGGSPWGQPNDYVHAGISMVVFTFPMLDDEGPSYPASSMSEAFGRIIARAIIRACPIGNFEIRMGGFRSFGYGDIGGRVEQNTGCYLTLRFGLGAAFHG